MSENKQWLTIANATMYINEGDLYITSKPDKRNESMDAVTLDEAENIYVLRGRYRHGTAKKLL